MNLERLRFRGFRVGFLEDLEPDVSTSDDPSAWVHTGQVYERLALEMTSLNVKSAFLNQPIEVAEVRGRFQSALKLGMALPQLLVRFGYANAMPRSLHRPVSEVLE